MSEADRLDQPFLSCEAVLTEAHFLLSGTAIGSRRIGRFVEEDVIRVPFSYADHAVEVNRLMAKFEDVPMSFADACLIRMVELHPGSRVYTTDHHFRIYRAHGNKPIPVVIPF